MLQNRNHHLLSLYTKTLLQKCTQLNGLWCRFHKTAISFLSYDSYVTTEIMVKVETYHIACLFRLKMNHSFVKMPVTTSNKAPQIIQNGGSGNGMILCVVA